MRESKNWNLSKNNDTLVCVIVNNTKNIENINHCFYGLSNSKKKIDVALVLTDASKDDVDIIKEMAKSPCITIIKQIDGESVEEINKSENELKCEVFESSAKNFPEIFNQAFNLSKKFDYDFFSIIEQDDLMSPSWLSYATQYAKELPDVGIFLPLIKNITNGIDSGFINEACWVEGMAEEAGVTDMQLLTKFNCINPLGGLYRVNSIKEFSEVEDDYYLPMKESIKITHYYEFFLRMVYNDIKIKTIDMLGYHLKLNVIENSFEHTSCKVPQTITSIAVEKGGIDVEEAKFWLKSAKKEYFYDEDRKLVYEQV